jgi:hypothetical protein
MTKLDQLGHLERDLTLAALQCDVNVAHPDDPATEAKSNADDIVRLGFFHYEHKVKLTVHLGVRLDHPSHDHIHQKDGNDHQKDDVKDNANGDATVGGVDYALTLIGVVVEYGRPDLVSSVERLLHGQLECSSPKGNVLLPLVSSINQLL